MGGIGYFRHRIQIYETVEEYDDSIGGVVTANDMISDYNDRVNVDGGTMEAQECVDQLLYKPVTEIWAKVEVVNGIREERDRTLEHRTEFKITIRTDSYPITTNSIILWKGIEMTIHDIIENHFDNYKEITAWG